MDHEELRNALEVLGITHPRFACLIGYDDHTIRQYALGEVESPRIELLLNFALYEPDSFSELVKARELLDDEL